MASSRTVIIAGAGIGGLTAALAIAQRGFRVAVLEQAARLEEIGAGIQLSPNASRILIALGLGEQLEPCIVVPEELRVINAQTARVLARAPLGAAVEQRYGAPYWVIHRGDLQRVLLDAVSANPDIALHLGTRVEDFAVHGNGVTVAALARGHAFEERGIALIGADGLWSNVRNRLGHRTAPRFARHTAWRALVPADAVVADLRAPAVNLWLGRNAHLVHYPVRNGKLVNRRRHHPRRLARGRMERGRRPRRDPRPLSRRHVAGAGARGAGGAAALAQMGALRPAPEPALGQGSGHVAGRCRPPDAALSRPGRRHRDRGRAVLGQRLADTPDDPAGAMRRYEDQRRSRTARAQRAARRNGAVYHLGGAAAFLRTLALIAMGGGARLMPRYDWLYGWKPA